MNYSEKHIVCLGIFFFSFPHFSSSDLLFSLLNTWLPLTRQNLSLVKAGGSLTGEIQIGHI